MDLKGSQISHLFQALLSIIVNFPHYGRDLSLSAIRCLINVLNKHGGRIESFVQDVNLNACKLLCAVIQNDEATSLTHSSFTDNFAESKSEGAADRTKKGEDKTAVDPLATSASTDKSYRAEDKQASNVYNDERKLSSDSKSDNAVNNDLSLVHYCVKVLYMATCQR
ncbi:hypothetical protein EON65_23230 [archaeon]|nr:MAG: hypothetical protein EON65_23230 [archaeon]